MSQVAIGAAAVAAYLAFMCGYAIGWRQARRPRCELEPVGADNIEDRVRRFAGAEIFDRVGPCE